MLKYMKSSRLSTLMNWDNKSPEDKAKSYHLRMTGILDSFRSGGGDDLIPIIYDILSISSIPFYYRGILNLLLAEKDATPALYFAEQALWNFEQVGKRVDAEDVDFKQWIARAQWFVKWFEIRSQAIKARAITHEDEYEAHQAIRALLLAGKITNQDVKKEMAALALEAENKIAMMEYEDGALSLQLAAKKARDLINARTIFIYSNIVKVRNEQPPSYHCHFQDNLSPEGRELSHRIKENIVKAQGMKSKSYSFQCELKIEKLPETGPRPIPYPRPDSRSLPELAQAIRKLANNKDDSHKLFAALGEAPAQPEHLPDMSA